MDAAPKSFSRRREINTLTVEGCGISDIDGIIYTREFLKRAKMLKQENLKYVWYRNGNIFVRRDEGEKAHKITVVNQLNSVIENSKNK